jgi:HEPN domain-containing protein
MNEVAQAWLEFAWADLQAAEELLEHEHLSGISCFHAQQCVEKTFKAVLEEFGRSVPKIHDVLVLGRQVEELLSVTYEERMFDDLNKLYIESRYPEEVGLLPYGKPTVDDARRLVGFAAEVYDEVTEALETDL